MIDTPQIVQTQETLYAYTRRTVPLERISVVMGPAIEVVVAAMQAQGLTPTGPWFTHHLRRPVDFFDFEVCFPLAISLGSSGSGDQEVLPGVWPAQRVARTTFHGHYAGLPHAWGELEQWMKTQGLAGGSEFWEVYTANPHTEPTPENWRTELNWPLEQPGN